MATCFSATGRGRTASSGREFPKAFPVIVVADHQVGPKSGRADGFEQGNKSRVVGGQPILKRAVAQVQQGVRSLRQREQFRADTFAIFKHPFAAVKTGCRSETWVSEKAPNNPDPARNAPAARAALAFARCQSAEAGSEGAREKFTPARGGR